MSADSFYIPSDVKEKFLKQKPKTAKEYAKTNNNGSTLKIKTGIFQSPGIETKYNSTIIEQNDGLVIIEAPYSSANSVLVIKNAEKLFPSKKIKAVVSTSQLWSHIAGIREYVANKIPVYLFESNKAVVDKVIKANYKTDPDALEKSRKSPLYLTVNKRTTVGAGENKFEIIPMRTGVAQRMLAVYFPVQKLLYASDLYSPKRFARNSWTEYITGLKKFVEREKLDVETVYGLHMPPIKYAELMKQLNDSK